MALYTDSNITGFSDLQAYDSAVLEVARIEGVDLTSKIAVADQEIALELQAFLLQQTGGPSAALHGGGFGLHQVVVTPGLQQWHTLRTLALVYGDVYNSQLNDRYLGKWNQFVALAKQTSEMLFLTGVGIRVQPLSRASSPSLTPVAGTLTPGTYVIGIAWRNHFGEHGAPSLPVTLEIAEGQTVMATPPLKPSGAVSYDVYAGLTEASLSLQTVTPVAAENSWTMPPGGLIEGDTPSPGQTPDRFIRRHRTLQRG
ncbi:MAG: hypothetical protein FJW20_02475 [Acidimicrobiia bacterium]|nr:hypothetical protein [Acidimicrobiia bacterium]